MGVNNKVKYVSSCPFLELWTQGNSRWVVAGDVVGQ